MREPDQTDEYRRLALQLALQLPASVSDARRVLALTSECLDEFLIEKSEGGSAAARARRIWGGPRPILVNSDPVPVTAGPQVLAVVLCCFGVLALAALVGAASIRLIGYGAAGANLIAVTVIGQLFGRWAALGGALGGFLLANWAVMPPAWDLAWPTTYELFGLAMSTVAAIVVPWIQARRDPLRAATLRAAGRPLRRLWRRAA